MSRRIASFVVAARTLGALVVTTAAVVVVPGCSSSGESASADALTAGVGKYPPAPAGVYRPRVGVPPFSVKAEGQLAGGEQHMEQLAADQMTTLLDQTERFDVIERNQLQHLMDEQNMEGIVKAGEMAKTGQVSGVDYLLLGRVTNLRLKVEHSQTGFGVGQVTGQFFNAGGLDIKNKDTKLTSEAGVDIRLVNPTTGKVLVSNFSEYKKTDSAGAMGVVVLGASANADADVSVSEDDKGKILRLALDDAMRKTLPKLDRFLTGPNNKATAGTDAAKPPVAPPPAAVVPPVDTTTPAVAAPANAVAAKRFCPTCGKPMAPGAKFCPDDGTKIE